MSRELYEIRLADKKQTYELVVILNPDLKNGRLLGGTCFIPPDPIQPDPKYFDKQLENDIDRLQKNSPRKITPEEILVVGGRPALREQDARRQLVEMQPPKPPAWSMDAIREMQRERMKELANQKAPERVRARELDDERDLY